MGAYGSLSAEPDQHPAAGHPWGEFNQAVQWVGMMALCLPAAVLWMRRLADALESPLPPWMLFAVGLAAAASVGGLRLARHRGSRRAGRSRLQDWLPTAALLSLGAALVLPGASPLGLAALWLPVAAEEAWHWRITRRRKTPSLVTESSQRPARVIGPPVAAAERVVDASVLQAAAAQSDLGGEVPTLANGESTDVEGRVVQRLTRTVLADGRDQLRGVLCSWLAAGQRGTSVHVAFCPPFACLPHLEFEQVEGPEARIKLAQLLPYGARLDIKLSAPAATATSLAVDFLAFATDPRRQAGA